MFAVWRTKKIKDKSSKTSDDRRTTRRTVRSCSNSISKLFPKLRTKKDMNLRNELVKARKKVKGLTICGRPDILDRYMDVVYADVLVCEENLRNRTRVWENASLAREFVDTVSELEEYDHLLDSLYSACSRMEDCIFEHPRLKLEFLGLYLRIVRRIESLNGHDLGAADDIEEEMDGLSRNIDLADYGRLDEIPQKGHLKTDPVEWTAEWEEVIDAVDEKVESELDGYRGMGYCFGVWSARTRILAEDYGIEWRSPSAMNPGVIFD